VNPIAAYMTTDLETARADTPLAEVARRLASRRISGVPIVDGAGAIAGVVSRYDLIHHQRCHPHAAGATCAAIMTRGPRVIELGAPLRDAARLMVAHRIHRVFVVDGGRLAGVLTTTDLTRAVEERRVAARIDTIMTSPVVTIRVDHGLALAMEWLDRARVTGLIVTEHDWPIGVFAQEDALAARELPPATEIGRLYDPSLICLPRETPIHRAAAQCARMGVRRIVVSHQRDFVGVVSGLDFAGVIAAAP
jgi:predicted transcriptional regulator